MADVKPCNIPVSYHGSDHDESLVSVEVPLGDAAQLETFCQHHGLASSVPFQAVWALVLRCYAGTDSPCFGCLTSDLDISVDANQNDISSLTKMVICSAQITDTDSIMTLLERMQADLIYSMPHQVFSLTEIDVTLDMTLEQSKVQLFNTAVWLHTNLPTSVPIGSSLPFSKAGRQHPEEASDVFSTPSKERLHNDNSFSTTWS